MYAASARYYSQGRPSRTIAPAGARLVVEAQVPNKDIAFIEKGLPVKLKF
jgi:hypothetical protein